MASHITPKSRRLMASLCQNCLVTPRPQFDHCANEWENSCLLDLCIASVSMGNGILVGLIHYFFLVAEGMRHIFIKWTEVAAINLDILCVICGVGMRVLWD